MPYEHRIIEPKWQARWRESKLHRTTFDPKRPKFYALDMFPYPSGAGLHVGHCEGYTATDIITRWKRMQGFNVLHPVFAHRLAVELAPTILPTYRVLLDPGLRDGPQGVQDVDFLVADLVGIEGDHGIHGHEAKELQIGRAHV